MDYSREKVANLYKYIERVNIKRGELINAAINLENLINNLLAIHFCKDDANRKELLSLIICKRISFANKNKILKEIVQKHYKHFLESYSTFFADVVTIIELRDRLAHMTLPVHLESGEHLKNKVIEFQTHDAEAYTITELEIDKAIGMAIRYVLLIKMNALANSSAP